MIRKTYKENVVDVNLTSEQLHLLCDCLTFYYLERYKMDSRQELLTDIKKLHTILHDEYVMSLK